jgi:hypothetical protein
MVGNAVILAVAAVTPCAVVISQLDKYASRMNPNELWLAAGSILAASLVALALLFWLIAGLRRALKMMTLRRALNSRLRAAGFAPDAACAEAQALCAQFWIEAQRDASRALAVQLAVSDARLNMLQSIRASMHSSRWALYIITAIWGFVVFGFFPPRAVSGLVPLLIMTAFPYVLAIFLFSTAGALRGAKLFADRRELALERRHIVALADLASAAGGLTLANDDDEALRGALSGDVASGGELSEVER